MTYDLRRLRAHGLITRIPHTRRYQITDTGAQHALLFTHAHAHLLRTGLAEITDPDPPAPSRLRTAGSVTCTGQVGYLPQDPGTGDPAMSAADRILSARGLDNSIRALQAAEVMMTTAQGPALDKAMNAYTRAEAEFLARGGYAAEAAAAQVAADLGLPERALSQSLGTLSGGQRRRVELARLLFAGHETLLLDDVELLEATVNRVFHLDANRATIDIYNLGWNAYLAQRETDDRRRRRERVNAERKAESLIMQADRMRANVKTAVAAKNMVRRAGRMLAELEPERRADRVARLRLPEPAPCGRTPLTANGLSKSYGSLEVFTSVDIAVDRGSRVAILGLNGAGKTTLLRIMAGHEQPDTGIVVHGHGLRLGYYDQEHDALDARRTVQENLVNSAPHLDDGGVRHRQLSGSHRARHPRSRGHRGVAA